MAVGNKAGARGAGAVARLGTFLREARAEFRKVHWPTRNELIRYTIVVLLAAGFVGVFIGFFDLLFSRLIAALTNLGR